MPSPDLSRELRAHAPAASPALRARVQAIPDRAASGSRRLPTRWLVLAALVACLLVAAGIAAAVELTRSPSRRALPSASTVVGAAKAPAQRAEAAPVPRSAAPAVGGYARIQNVDAYLRLRVADRAALTRATKRAQALARELGGFVGSVDYEAGGRSATADLTLRVPVGRVQEATARLQTLGTVVSQHLSTSDAQGGVDDLSRRIASLRTQRAALRAQLRDQTLTRQARTALQLRLARLARELPALLRRRAEIEARARLATVSLELFTPHRQAVPPAAPGRFDRALDELARVLEREAIVLLYVAVIAAPFALAFAAARAVRRRGDRRLLA
jgi:uncharacterized small protein (DUF1192 family)